MRATLDISVKLAKETFEYLCSTSEENKKIIKQIIGMYLECVRLNQGFDDAASEKIAHSIQHMCTFLKKWAAIAIGSRFGEYATIWRVARAEYEIKVTINIQFCVIKMSYINRYGMT